MRKNTFIECVELRILKKKNLIYCFIHLFFKIFIQNPKGDAYGKTIIAMIQFNTQLF